MLPRVPLDENLYFKFSFQLRLEDKINENVGLQRQLDSAVAEMRRMKEQQREKIAAAVRSASLVYSSVLQF